MYCAFPLPGASCACMWGVPASRHWCNLRRRWPGPNIWTAISSHWRALLSAFHTSIIWRITMQTKLQLPPIPGAANPLTVQLANSFWIPPADQQPTLPSTNSSIAVFLVWPCIDTFSNNKHVHGNMWRYAWHCALYECVHTVWCESSSFMNPFRQHYLIIWCSWCSCAML